MLERLVASLAASVHMVQRARSVAAVYEVCAAAQHVYDALDTARHQTDRELARAMDGRGIPYDEDTVRELCRVLEGARAAETRPRALPGGLTVPETRRAPGASYAWPAYAAHVLDQVNAGSTT